MTNRYWIEIYDASGTHYCGSDGCVPLDGRLGHWRAIDEGYKHCHSLRFVKPDIAGFTISRGVSAMNLRPVSDHTLKSDA